MRLSPVLQSKGGMQLLSLLMKIDVHCVWLANGGIQGLNTRVFNRSTTQSCMKLV